MSSFIFYLITREATVLLAPVVQTLDSAIQRLNNQGLVANFAAHVSDTLQVFDLGL